LYSTNSGYGKRQNDRMFSNHKITVAICFHGLDGPIGDVQGNLKEQLLENLSRKDVAPIRGSPYNLMAYDIVLQNWRMSRNHAMALHACLCYKRSLKDVYT
jgi:hypothetical protein